MRIIGIYKSNYKKVKTVKCALIAENGQVELER